MSLARPFFEYLAKEALKDSKLNVRNNSEDLLNRYQYHLSLYEKRTNYANRIKGKKFFERQNGWPCRSSKPFIVGQNIYLYILQLFNQDLLPVKTSQVWQQKNGQKNSKSHY